MTRPSGEKTSLPLISKLDSDGDSPNCSDDDVAIGAGDDFLTAIGAKDSQVLGASSGRGSASKKDLTGMVLGSSPLLPSQSQTTHLKPGTLSGILNNSSTPNQLNSFKLPA